MTPLEDGLLGHAKKRSTVRCRDSPAFHDMVEKRVTAACACSFCWTLLYACGDGKTIRHEIRMDRQTSPFVCVFLLSVFFLNRNNGFRVCTVHTASAFGRFLSTSPAHVLYCMHRTISLKEINDNNDVCGWSSRRQVRRDSRFEGRRSFDGNNHYGHSVRGRGGAGSRFAGFHWRLRRQPSVGQDCATLGTHFLLPLGISGRHAGSNGLCQALSIATHVSNRP
jgi:hypothetical protein